MSPAILISRFSPDNGEVSYERLDIMEQIGSSTTINKA